MRRSVYVLFVLVTVASLLLAACGAEGVMPTPMPTQTPTTQPTKAPAPVATPTTGSGSSATTALPSFAYVAVRVNANPSLATYTFSPDKVINAALLRELSDEQKALLTANGFVVVPASYGQIYDIYKNNKDRGTPNFVTTDSVLHSYHILYDYVLRSVEYDNLIAAARGLTAAMLATSGEQYAQAQGAVKESARVTLAFFSVAAKLLDASTPVDADVRAVVDKELALIEAHKGYGDSPLFGYKEDYSQYARRGHYTRNDQFKIFFKAMMWYGRIGFRLQPGTTEQEKALGVKQTRRALLIVAALESSKVGQETALKVWDRIYGPTAFFVGTSDDLTVYDYKTVAAAVWGKTPTLQSLADEGKLDAFIAAAQKLPAPRIVSSYVTDEEDPALVTKSFRFMGQRFIPDSYIFQQLVYDKVGTRSQPRLFPKGLDVLSVFGSQRAYEILDSVYKETAYDKYKEQVGKLRSEFSALPQSDWTRNLYWGWLYSLLPLTKPAGQGYPSFMQTAAWTDKQLNTALGSWAELRHDTILYAKQSTTIKATAMFPSEQEARGYVEPNAEVYARLAALAAQTRDGLQSRGLLAGEYAAKLASFEKLLLSLKTISEKELNDQARSDDEYELIRSLGTALEGLTTFSVTEAGKLSSETDQRMAVVADVHTDSNSQQALEEGVGDAFPIYVLVPVEGKLTLTKGSVFSYYEFTMPLEQRLTDEAWQKMSPRPELPVWTSSFVK